MQINVDLLAVTGRQVDADDATPWAAEAARDALEGDVVTLSASLDIAQPKADRHVDIRIEATATVSRHCDRCRESIVLSVSTSRQLGYLPAGGTGGDEVDLEAEELEVGWYESPFVDLGHILREALALELPARVTCSDAASCEARTAALLADSTEDDGAVGHPAFAVLKQLQ